MAEKDPFAPDGAAQPAATTGGKVKLRTAHRLLSSVTVDGIVIDGEGADVTAEQAERAHASARAAGFHLEEVKE